MDLTFAVSTLITGALERGIWEEQSLPQGEAAGADGRSRNENDFGFWMTNEE